MQQCWLFSVMMLLTLGGVAYFLNSTWPLVLTPRAAKKRSLRKEFRSLTQDEWNDVVNAMWVMKRTPQEEGERLYGPYFRTYDWFVSAHIDASLNPKCDTAHFSPIFITWHRIYLLQFERALQAVNPNITGLPYWDYRQDASDPGHAEGPFTEHFFGSWVGDITQQYQVTDGRFAGWPIARRGTDVYGWTSLAGGFLRGPMNMNTAPNVTRNGGTMCKQSVGVGKIEQWEGCLETSNIRTWHRCIDYDVHGEAHFGVAGGWSRFEGQTVPDVPYNDPPLCSSFYGMVGDHGEFAGDVGSYIYPINAGCLNCTKCKPETPIKECVCQCTQPDCTCEGVWTQKMELKETMVDPKYVEIVGDMYDPISSPNDPLFMFHHTNMDRFFMAWQQRHIDQAPYFDWPTNRFGTGDNYCKAHLLEGIVNPHQPFSGLIDDLPADKPITNRDILEHITFEKAPYEYDTIA